MKKVLAIILAAVLVLSCNMTAFAQVIVDGSAKGNKVSVDSAHFVEANDSGDDLTVTGDVDGKLKSSHHSVMGTGGAKITVEGDVAEEYGMNAVNAMSGASVTVEKNVKESDGGHAIYANNATVEIKENVEENGTGDAIYVYGKAQVSVKGSVTENGYGNAIYADGATVKVGGNVTDGVETTADASNAVSSGNGATVIVEGLVTGQLSTNDQTDSGTIYIGELNGNIKENADLSKIHYLIGAADGSASFDSLIVTGDIPIDPSETIDGIKKRNYYYTATADSAILSGKSLILKPSDSKKKLVVEGISTDADVTLTPNADGTVTLTLGSNFKGGLQDLMLILEDIIVKNSSGGGSTKTLFTGNTGNPVTNGRWTQNADGTWSYATTSKFTNTWGCIANPNDAGSAAWYYFDRNGNMLTGWQKLYWNGAYRWYYFSQTKDSNEGKCQLGGITPDGYKVGPDGAWIED